MCRGEWVKTGVEPITVLNSIVRRVAIDKLKLKLVDKAKAK